VEPLIRAAEAGEDVPHQLLHEAAHQLQKDGNPAAAVRLLSAAHLRYPRAPELAAHLAEAAEAAGHTAAAVEAHVAAGALCGDIDERVSSLDHFTAAGAAAPSHPLAALGRCQALLSLERFDEALAALADLRETQADLAGVHAVSALAHAMLGNPEAATAAVTAGLRRFPRDPWLLDTRIRLLVGTGEEEAALIAADDALLVDPTDREWRSLRAQLLLARDRDTEQAEEAVATLRDLAESVPESPLAATRLVSALQLTSRAGEALDYVERALERHPREFTLLSQQVHLLTAVGRHREARDRAGEAQRIGVPPAAVALPLAESLLRLGDAAAAATKAGEALAAVPSSAAARRVRGLAWHAAGRLAEAVDDLEASDPAGDAEVRGALVDSLVTLASAVLVRREVDGSREWLERALELDPGNHRARQWFAEALRVNGELTSALTHADQALQTQPDNGWLLGTRGQILESLGQEDRAEADLRRAVELNPKLDWAWAELGELLRGRRAYAEAVRHLERATRVKPDDPWPWASKGAALYSLERYDEALAALDRALELHGGYAWAHALKAAVLTDIDRLDAAAGHIERGLALDDSMAWAWNVRGWLLLLQAFDSGAAVPGLIERSVESYTRELVLSPGSARALIGAGEAQLCLGRVAEGTAAMERAVAHVAGQDTEEASAQAGLGWCRLRLRDHDAAVDAYVTAVALDSTHIPAAFGLALTLLCWGRTETAVEEYTQALARTEAAPHEGRRRYALRVARRDLDALAADQLTDRPADVAAVRRLLEKQGGSDARHRAGGLPVP
jgi:tetratricopeptide (TPR) repeat protein